MMQASLHTAEPKTAGEYEVSYSGYARVCLPDPGDFRERPVEVLFPEAIDGASETVTYICLSDSETGQIIKIIPMMPYIKAAKGERPRVIVVDIVPLPEALHPIARTVYELVHYGEIAAENLHPALYEAVNRELENHGVPVMRVSRSGAANMKAILHNISGPMQ